MAFKPDKRTRRAFINAAAIFSVYFSALLLFPPAAVLGNDQGDNSKSTGYNIVMIIASGLRADHLGCYGYFRKTSPNIDKLAKESILFDTAISQSYWTLPSLVSMFTSEFMSRHNVDSRNIKLGENKKTLTEILNAYGYVTAAFTCGLDTAATYGLNRGFNVYDVYGGDKVVGSFSDIIPPAIKWLDKNKNNDFFLFLHSYDVHPPYENCVDKNFSKDYKGIFESSQLDYNELRRINGHKLYSEDRQINLEQKDIDYIVSRYDDCIEYLDRFIGDFIEELKRLNLYKKTIIILCADHGEELGERGTFNRFGNQNLYQEVIRVPLIIKYPSSRLNGKRVNSLVELVDIMPTILDLLNIPVEHDLQGLSFAGLIKNGMNVTVHKYAVSEASKHKWSILREDGWKLLYSSQGKELYNINIDPLEHNNLAENNLDIQVSLMKDFFLWREYHKKEEKTDNYLKLDSDMIEKLKKAGYW